MSRNAISYVEDDHKLENEEGEPVHVDPVKNADNIDEYEHEKEGDNEYENDGFLVGDDVDVDMPDDVGNEEKLAVEEDVVGSEDELADFIVDEDGIGHLRKRNHKKMKYMQDANEIFGDVHELLLTRKKGLASSEEMEKKA